MADARQQSPSAARNRDPLLAVLRDVLPPAGAVLEVGSGSGEHAVHFARALPHLTFHPSDADPVARASVAAWTAHEALSNLAAPRPLDLLDSSSWPQDSFQALLCINVIHIAPPEASEALMELANRVLPVGGVVVTYGPYRVGGEHTAPSNEAFERGFLKAKDPRFGVRNVEDLEALAGPRGLVLEQRVTMPANNFTLVWRRR